MLMYRKKLTLSGRNVTVVMRKFSISLPVSPMIVKQGKQLTTANIFKNVC